jgi:iron complex transport system ATP-binding protein
MIDGLIGKGISVIMVTHRLEDIPKNIGRVIGIKGGLKVADGKKEDVLSDASVSEIYGADVKVTSDGGIYTLSVLPQNL